MAKKKPILFSRVVPKDDREHLWRTLIVAVLAVAVLAALVTLYVVNVAEGLREHLEGTLIVLIPALLDSVRVAEKQKRRRQSLVPHPRPVPNEQQPDMAVADTNPSIPTPESMDTP